MESGWSEPKQEKISSIKITELERKWLAYPNKSPKPRGNLKIPMFNSQESIVTEESECISDDSDLSCRPDLRTPGSAVSYLSGFQSNKLKSTLSSIKTMKHDFDIAEPQVNGENGQVLDAERPIQIHTKRNLLLSL